MNSVKDKFLQESEVIKKPKSAILAYLALAEKLNSENLNPIDSLVPFLGKVCLEFEHGKVFKPDEFIQKIEENYGLSIPQVAVKGLQPHLEKHGFLKEFSKNPSLYKYDNSKINESLENPTISQEKIEVFFSEFISICKKDDILNKLSDSELESEFVNRLLNIDSLKIIRRKEITNHNTLTISKNETPNKDYRLDFIASEYLIKASEIPEKRKILADFAFAAMAAETITSFHKENSNNIDLQLILDAPLILDYLNINSSTTHTPYIKELIKLISKNNFKVSIFDHTINEIESILKYRIRNNENLTQQVKSSYGNIAKIITKLGFSVLKDISETRILSKNPQYREVIDAYLEQQMINWRNGEAISNDKKSIYELIAYRNKSAHSSKISESRYLFITRNSALSIIGNNAWKKWLVDVHDHSESSAATWSPIILTDHQLAGYLWMNFGQRSEIPLSRLLANCSSAIRPRDDVKNRALELASNHLTEEDSKVFAALLSDKDSVNALMHITKSDPLLLNDNNIATVFDEMLSNASEQAIRRKTAELESLFNNERVIHDRTIKEKDENLQVLIKQSNSKEKELSIKALALIKSERVNEKLLIENRIEKITSKIDNYKKFQSSYSATIKYFKYLSPCIIGLFTFLISFKLIDENISAIASIF